MSKRSVLCGLLIALLFAGGDPVQAQSDEEGPDGTVDAATRAAVIEETLKQLHSAYVFPETAKAMDFALRERQKKGEYDRVTSARKLAELLTEHLRAVSRDKHLGLFYSARPLPPQLAGEPSSEDRERFRKEAAQRNYGFRKVERLPGNIGYLTLDGFESANLAGPTAAAAMTFLAETDALVIDLRQNGGGDPEMVALLCSYLFGEEPVHLNDLYYRPDDSTRQYWTFAYVPGKRYGPTKPVYVLTSARTFSGAEEFSYNLKNLKRATLIGETTGGGAHPGDVRRITEHFGAFIPTGRAINPITKTNWEGTGVTPHVPVAADEALKTAHIAAVKKLLEAEKEERRAGALKRLLADLENGTLRQ